MSTDLLVSLLQDLDAPQHRIHQLDNYFQGTPPLSSLSAADKVALAKFDRLSANMCRAAVLAVQERLRVSGFTGAAKVWDLWVANDLDQLSSVAHRDALLYGGNGAFVICWVRPDGKPVATIESAKQVQVQRDPVTREVVAAVKRVRTKTTTEAWVYLPDEVQHWRANAPGAATAGFELVGSVPNTLGVVPVVPIGLTDDVSAIADLLTIQDALNKLLLDAMVASEYTGRPRRFATGIEAIERPKLDDDGNPVLDDDDEPVMEAVNPYPESNRMMLAESEEANFGQLAASDLGGFEAGVRVILAQAMMCSGLPAHYLGQLTAAAQPTSADALRASEAALVARVEARQLAYGTGWEQVARLLIAIRDTVTPDEVAVQVHWSPADTRSQAQEADAAVKLFSAGILSRSAVLRKLGYSEDEIAAELDASRTDAQIGQDIRLGRYISDTTAHKAA